MKNTDAHVFTKLDVVQEIFSHTTDSKDLWIPKKEKGLAFAPTNIALCKYWGKRDTEINLPVTSSLSIALPDKGAMTTITPHDQARDIIILNDVEIENESQFAKQTVAYFDLFRPNKNLHFRVDIKMNIPVAAGLASSACGFASLICALNDLFEWKLSLTHLSILARLGSGSAARSLWMGFVEWHAGVAVDGMDSYGEPLETEWPTLQVGILTLSPDKKRFSSRDAMLRTVNSSALYGSWIKKVNQDLPILKQAIKNRNFSLLGGAAESNALAMHATMLSSWPPICYSIPETIAMMHQIWDLRAQGLEVYFTQDAGPNLKLLFLEQNKKQVQENFPQVEVINVF